MNQIYLWFIVLGGFFYQDMKAQILAIPVDSGALDGVGYRIIFPANWKNKLVMYAHGYEFMGARPLQSQNPAWMVAMQPFLERGYAVAASDYRLQGFAMAEGLEDTERLRQYFIKTYGQPDSVFIVGHSMGGGITLATIEYLGQYYLGGLPLCPLSSRPYLQCRKEFDMYATFNGLFPGIVRPLQQIFDLDTPLPSVKPTDMFSQVMAWKERIFQKDSSLAIAFARKFDLKPDDLPFALFFNERVLRDLAEKSGGNPFDNTNTVYSGFPDDLLVNQEAERLAATVDERIIFDRYDRHGNIMKPVLLMHTIYDQLIPPSYGVVNFENMVHHQGKDALFSVKYTDGQGHCNFTPRQTGQAFDVLRAWVSTGKKPSPGLID